MRTVLEGAVGSLEGSQGSELSVTSFSLQLLPLAQTQELRRHGVPQEGMSPAPGASDVLCQTFFFHTSERKSHEA